MLREDLAGLMRARVPTVLDISFWQQTSRHRYKALITECGCTWELVHLRVDVETLRARLARRAERFDANAAFAISEAQLAGYLEGFEPPCGEGETVLSWQPSPGG